MILEDYIKYLFRETTPQIGLLNTIVIFQDKETTKKARDIAYSLGFDNDKFRFFSEESICDYCGQDSINVILVVTSKAYSKEFIERSDEYVKIVKYTSYQKIYMPGTLTIAYI